MLQPREEILETLEKIIEKLDEAEGDKASRVEWAIDQLVSLCDDLSEDSELQEQLSRFRPIFTTLLFGEDNFGGLNVYIGECCRYAERGRLDGFETACWRRSYLQDIHDFFIDWERSDKAEIRRFFQEGLEDIDETIREVSDDAPPVRESDIPEWDAEKHWWWRAPQRQDMSEAERKLRLEYDHWDGVED